MLGLVLAVVIEWINADVLRTWAYSSLMPIIPLIDVGLSTIAQWFVIPLAASVGARTSYSRAEEPEGA
jgi:hypothetical protein